MVSNPFKAYSCWGDAAGVKPCFPALLVCAVGGTLLTHCNTVATCCHLLPQRPCFPMELVQVTGENFPVRHFCDSIKHQILTSAHQWEESLLKLSGTFSVCNFCSVCPRIVFRTAAEVSLLSVRGTHKAMVADPLVSLLLLWDLTLMEPHGCTRLIPLAHIMLGR